MAFERLREADSIWKKKSLLSIYSHPHRKVTTFGSSFKFQSWTQVNTGGATSPGLWAHGGMHRAIPWGDAQSQSLLVGHSERSGSIPGRKNCSWTAASLFSFAAYRRPEAIPQILCILIFNSCITPSWGETLRRSH